MKNYLEYGTKYCKESPTIEEYILQDAIMKAICQFVEDKDELIDTLKHSLRLALNAEKIKITRESRHKCVAILLL